MFLQEVLTVPQTGNPKIDAIAQASIVGLSLASVFLAAWKKQQPSQPKKKSKAKPPAMPVPRTAPRRALDDMTGNG